MALTKKLKFDNDVLSVIKAMEFSDDGLTGRITSGQLDRQLYVKVDKALKVMGGKWNRKTQAHIFSTDPRLSVEGLLDNGHLEVTNEGWFFTPRLVIERMIVLVGNLQGRILEPSAGEGHLADLLVEHGALRSCIHCIEKNEQRARVLWEKGYSVQKADFLDTGPHDLFWRELFDKVFMNPPFEERQDAEHIIHAHRLLKLGGVLISVCSEGLFFGNDKPARHFREWLDKVMAYDEQLPPGAFKEAGTNVMARLVMVTKDQDKIYQPKLSGRY